MLLKNLKSICLTGGAALAVIAGGQTAQAQTSDSDTESVVVTGTRIA